MMLNPYVGSELSEIECEFIALERVSLSLLKEERELYKTAWFDYRALHPTKRTYLFAHYYEEAFRHMIRLHVDYEQVEGPAPRSYLPRKDPLGKPSALLAKEAKSGKSSPFRNTTCIWKARQKADLLGIPYDVFCMSGMKAAIGRIWQRIPTPGQLYSINILEQIIDRWEVLLSERIYAATSDFYTLRRWNDHPSQQDHSVWLCRQIVTRSRPEFALMEYGFKRPMIHPQDMRVHFSQEVISSARSLSKCLL